MKTTIIKRITNSFTYLLDKQMRSMHDRLTSGFAEELIASPISSLSTSNMPRNYEKKISPRMISLFDYYNSAICIWQEFTSSSFMSMSRLFKGSSKLYFPVAILSFPSKLTSLQFLFLILQILESF